ncbi:MAG TPA: hypothetical protein VJ371_02575 [Streptosporangiaceae bacterium]|nr:hypothetical protein [Streptosporangiaceae bacterium]
MPVQVYVRAGSARACGGGEQALGAHVVVDRREEEFVAVVKGRV